MTEKQYKRYQEIEAEIKDTKNFLGWCGNKYKSCTYSGKYPFILRILRKGFALTAKKPWNSIDEATYYIPQELQERIIKVIEQYVDEKEQEKNEI
jgi:hypothetical protein